MTHRSATAQLGRSRAGLTIFDRQTLTPAPAPTALYPNSSTHNRNKVSQHNLAQKLQQDNATRATPDAHQPPPTETTMTRNAKQILKQAMADLRDSKIASASERISRMGDTHHRTTDEAQQILARRTAKDSNFPIIDASATDTGYSIRLSNGSNWLYLARA